jgi:molybdenum cofactor synthesis domain-containing protein
MQVALVSVGDELLSGETVNTNASWLGRALADRGVDVERVTVVPDREADIARVVNEYHAEYDAVLVTGGLGPTHDDITMQAVATAFGVALERNEAALEWLEANGGYAREDLAEGTGELPAGSRMLPNTEGVAPGCVIGDVYVLPGVPHEMKAMFEDVADEFAGEDRYVESVEVDDHESALLDRLAGVRERYEEVKVGSYPGETVRVRFEGTDEEAVAAAAAWFRERV